MRGFGWRVGHAVLATALVNAAPAMAAERVFATAEKPISADLYPDRATTFPGGVAGYPDVVYSVIPGYRPLIIDVYVPAGAAAKPKPLILYIHGGGWVGGHTRHAGAIADFPKQLAALAAEGFVVASLEYRLAKEAPFPAQLQDARAAIRFLKDNAGKYGIDPARVALWGGSAGGHLASLAALSCGDTKLDPAPAAPGSECVQGAAIWYGVFDFAPMIALEASRPGGPGGASGLLGCTNACPADKVTAASPVSYVDAKDPPFLLIHGVNDRTVPVAQSRGMEARLQAAGVPVEAIYIEGVDHSFIGATPADTRAATLRAVNATYDFFHKLFPAAR